MNKKNFALKKRILEISLKYHKAHISSSLIAVDCIDAIYRRRKKNEPFILSSGCAGLGLFVVLEKYEHKDAETLFKKYGTYPQRNLKDGIYCSAGSLGHGIGVAVGMAIADRKRNVYCMITDGECAEGSVWEALRIATECKLTNLRLYCIANGYAAYASVDVALLEKRLRAFTGGGPRVTVVRVICNLPHLTGVQGRYRYISQKEYHDILRVL